MRRPPCLTPANRDKPALPSGLRPRTTVVGCACPDCGSPLAIRTWLRLAECWNCATRIELSAEAIGTQSSADLSDLGSNARGDLQSTSSTPYAAQTPDSLEDPWTDSWEADFDWPDSDSEPSGLSEPYRRRSLLGEVPAWLTSMVLHLVLVLLLALFTWQGDNDEPQITLALEVGLNAQTGDQAARIMPDQDAYDLPAPMDELPDDIDKEAAMRDADADAKTLRLDPLTDDPNLPTLADLQARAQSRDPHKRTLVYRDPRLRSIVIRHEGGTTLTEAAVARGLAWFARNQHSDGSWTLDGKRHRSAATSLALLPFLGAGQTHLTGVYRETVGSGLRFLLERQRPNGDLRLDSDGNFGMYVHGQATIVLCEALAMTLDERLREPAQNAVDFIVAAQHPRGGWRYSPGEEGDTSVLGWQLMALQSAKSAGLRVPQETLDLSDQYLETVQSHNGARYAYQPGREDTHTMSAEGLLCRIYLGWDLQHPALRRGVRMLMEDNPPSLDSSNYYYWYYATQVLHHHGGRAWRVWNAGMRQILVGTQETSGRNAGSWPDDDDYSRTAGRIYSTSLATCTLEVYYRHAPIFRRLETAEIKGP